MSDNMMIPQPARTPPASNTKPKDPINKDQYVSMVQAMNPDADINTVGSTFDKSQQLVGLGNDPLETANGALQQQGILQPNPNPTTPGNDNPSPTTTGNNISQGSMFNPTHTMKTGGGVQQQSSNRHYPKGYISFAEEVSKEFEREEDMDGKDHNHNEQMKGLTKIENAKLIIKQMNDKECTPNEIVHALVSRLQISYTDAFDIVMKKVDVNLDASITPQDQYVPGANTEPNGRTDAVRNNLPLKTDIPKKVTEDAISEDNDYNHITGLYLRTDTNEDLMDQYKQKDNFEWELSSTKYLAKALIYQNRFLFEVKLKVLTSNQSKWPYTWRFLKPHNVNNVLTLTINQIMSDPSYMRIASTGNPIYGASESNLIESLYKMMQSYHKVWERSNYQILLLSTDNGLQLPFLASLAQKLCSISGYKIDPILSAEFSDKYINAVQKPTFYIAIKNSQGQSYTEGLDSPIDYNSKIEKLRVAMDNTKRAMHKASTPQEKRRMEAMLQRISIEISKLKMSRAMESIDPLAEDELGEMTTSAAFAVTPVNNAYPDKANRKKGWGGQTGDEINAQSRRNLDRMFHGVRQTEAIQQDKPSHDKGKVVQGITRGDSEDSRYITYDPTKEMEAHRMYYLKYPNGEVEAFTSKDERDYRKEKEDGENILASEYFYHLEKNKYNMFQQDNYLSYGDDRDSITVGDEDEEHHPQAQTSHHIKPNR